MPSMSFLRSGWPCSSWCALWKTWMTFVRHGFLLFFSSCHVQAMEGGLVLWQVSHMKEFFRSRAKLMSPLLAGSICFP